MRIGTIVAATVTLAALVMPIAVPASATAAAPAATTGVPRPVTDLTATTTADGIVVLDWKPAARGPKATSYFVRLTYVQPDRTFRIGGTSTDPQFTIGLPDMKFVTADTTLYASVRAVNAAGRSTPVRVLVVKPTG